MEKGPLSVLSVLLFVALIGLGFAFTDQNAVFVIMISVVVVVLMALYVLFFMHKRHQRIARLEADVSTKDTLLKRKAKVEERLIHDMPVGILLFDEDFMVHFANDAAKSIFRNPLEKRSLKTLHKGIHDAVASDALEQKGIFKIYNDYYEVHYQAEERVLFLFEENERERLKEKYERSTSVIGVLHLDNLDDAIDVLDVQEQSEIQGQLLGTLDEWAERKGFHLVPYTSSKLFVYMQRSHLDELIEGEFDIIEDIATIARENDLFVTLSGGIACADIPLRNLASIAEEALDLALSRGGDQIVINIQGEDFKYFGGNTNTQEKRTRISSRINAKKIDLIFDDASKVFIMPHIYPDADALSAAVGVLKMALASEKEAYVVLDQDMTDDTVEKIFTRMKYEHFALGEYFITPEKALQLIDRHSILTLVDHHSENQLLEEKLIGKAKGHIIIDHHRRHKDILADPILSYIEPYASSSTELVVEMANVYPEAIEFNRFEATVMLLGMVVDTNNFMYRTGSRTFEAAAVLKKYGADTQRVRAMLRESLQEIRIKSEILHQAEIIDKRYAIAIVPDDMDADRALLAKLANDLLEIDHIDAAFAIGQIESDTVAISARSLEGFSVQRVMEAFDGGGHLTNAGAQIEKQDKETVKTELVKYLQESKQEEKPMKVILQKDIKNHGKKGEVVDVKPGFGNYLLSSGQAIEATPENIQSLEKERQKAKEEAEKHYEEMKTLKKRLDHRSVKVYAKIGDDGKMFGKITPKQIAEALEEQHDITIDKRKIELDETINALGSYQVRVKLHKDVEATFEVLVLEQ